MQDVAAAARQNGQLASADLAARAAELNSRSWDAYSELTPARKLLVEAALPGSFLLWRIRERMRSRRKLPQK